MGHGAQADPADNERCRRAVQLREYAEAAGYEIGWWKATIRGEASQWVPVRPPQSTLKTFN